MTSAEVGAFASDMEAGDRGGVAAGLDGQFFVAVQDPEMGVFDDDGDQLAGVAGSQLEW